MIDAISKRLLALRLQFSSIKDHLPEIFDDIDENIPHMIGLATGYEVEELIARAIYKATGKMPKKSHVRLVVLLYSPVAAAAKAYIKRQK